MEQYGSIENRVACAGGPRGRGGSWCGTGRDLGEGGGGLPAADLAVSGEPAAEEVEVGRPCGEPVAEDRS